MRNNKACLYYIASEFKSKEILNDLAPISEVHSKLLYTNIFNNAAEQIGNVDNVKKFICFPVNGDPVIDEDISSQFEFINYNFEENIYEKLFEKQPDEYGRSLLIFPNTIGFSSQDILRVLDLLLNDGNALVIGKTKDNRICFIGTNFWDSQLLNHISASNFEFDKLLEKICKENVYYYVLNGYLKIDKINDFKDLYILLSNRESEDFCTENIHEKFTNLFIEYKELL
ncbi:MAG TPA: hypothetical protein ENI57_07530 [Ignavibacteria bacterium]|nr:hypothetical protein [Ignavibacteria bacterium]